VGLGLCLNSYLLALEGEIDVFRIPDAARLWTRDDVRLRLGANVFVQRADAYTYGQPHGEAQTCSIPLSSPDALALFALREALLEHCVRRGATEAWAGKAAELHAKGFLPPIDVNILRLESVTGLRLSAEEFVPEGLLLTVRHRRAWRTAGTLADPDLASRARGVSAVRIAGDGPARARVEDVANGIARLRTRDTVVEAAASHYALAATTALVAAWRGSAALREVRLAAGDVMQNGRANPAAVRDRFKAADAAKEMLGDTVPIRGDGEVRLPPQPVTVRLEVAP
jgi:hypothetical protein